MCPHTVSKAGHVALGHRSPHSRVSDAKLTAASPDVWRDGGFSLSGFPWGTESHTCCSGRALCPATPTPLASYFSRMRLFESRLAASNAMMCAQGELLTCGCLWISLRRCAARKRKVRQGTNSTKCLLC